jgi:hypothetical protein
MIADNSSLVIQQLKRLSSQDWSNFGVNDLAYMKPVILEGESRYAIHAANGAPLAVMDTREVAEAAIMQNELKPLSVH